MIFSEAVDLQEAECRLIVARAERDVCRAKKKLVHYRAKESLSRARLYNIQVAKADRRVEIADTKVGRAHMGVHNARKVAWKTHNLKADAANCSTRSYPRTRPSATNAAEPEANSAGE